MNDLIFTFNNEQIKLYNALLTEDNIELNFDTDLKEQKPFALETFNLAATKMENEAKKLLEYKKSNTAFSYSLSKDEIKEFIPAYYNAINNIYHYKKSIQEDIFALANQINVADKICADISQRYSKFLPYKAALYNRKEYSYKIEQIDQEFSKSIQNAQNHKKELLFYFNIENSLCDIVSDFFQKSSIATNEPKFENLNTKELFLSIDSFIEQINTIIKQKEM